MYILESRSVNEGQQTAFCFICQQPDKPTIHQINPLTGCRTLALTSLSENKQHTLQDSLAIERPV